MKVGELWSFRVLVALEDNLGFSSQHLYCGTQPSVTLILGNLTLSSDFLGH